MQVRTSTGSALFHIWEDKFQSNCLHLFWDIIRWMEHLFSYSEPEKNKVICKKNLFQICLQFLAQKSVKLPDFTRVIWNFEPYFALPLHSKMIILYWFDRGVWLPLHLYKLILYYFIIIHKAHHSKKNCLFCTALCSITYETFQHFNISVLN